MTDIQLQSYLKFGYDLSYKNSNYRLDFTKIDKAKYEKADHKELIRIGKDILFQSFDSSYVASKKYLIPISGGWDSRAIFGLLQNYRESSKILTYTFGTPNTFDYDIGNYIAKRHQTVHLSFDLTKHIYTEAEFLEAIKRFDYQSPLFLHPPIFELDAYYKDATILSGANAGAVVGSFVPDEPSKSLEEAFLKFCKKGHFTKSIQLHNSKDTEFLPLMSVNPIDSKLLTYDEQVFFNERSVKHLAPHVLIKGFEYQLPFINNPFMDFMLSVDNKYRKHKTLYYDILNHSFPELFKYPTEGKYGLKSDVHPNIVKFKRYYIRSRNLLSNKWPKIFPYTSPMTNYLDFNRYFKTNQNIKKIIVDALKSLENRGLINWVEILPLWEAHQSGKSNYADAIIQLVSIEYLLRSKS